MSEANRFRVRAWDSDTKTMFLPDAIDNRFEIWSGEKWTYEDDDGELVTQECGGILMQSTGLTDKNGMEIFEGDVVEFTLWWFDGNVAESQLSGTIAYSPELMSFQLKGIKNKEWERHTGLDSDTEYLTAFSELTFDEADFTVLGNIHENPELLETP